MVAGAPDVIVKMKSAKLPLLPVVGLVFLGDAPDLVLSNNVTILTIAVFFEKARVAYRGGGGRHGAVSPVGVLMS